MRIFCPEESDEAKREKEAADYFFGFPGDSHTYRFGKHCFYASKSKSCVSAYDENTGETVYVDAPERYSDLTGEKLIEDFKGKSIFFLSGKS